MCYTLHMIGHIAQENQIPVSESLTGKKPGMEERVLFHKETNKLKRALGEKETIILKAGHN